jgi:protein-S-isoprenylcysteine O-methyltransferase Ste14
MAQVGADGSTLRTRAYGGVARTTLALALLLFGSAGSLRYPQAWAYWALFGGACLAITAHFLDRDPALVERRLRSGARAEPDLAQRALRAPMLAAFVGLFVLSGLERRVHGSPVAPVLVVLADLVVVGCFGIVYLVFRENSFASSLVEVADRQPVVSTGPYAVVRHPMYSGVTLLLVATPLALGAPRAYVFVVPIVALVVDRLRAEERLLARELPGYEAYRERVRFRLVPGIW